MGEVVYTSIGQSRNKRTFAFLHNNVAKIRDLSTVENTYISFSCRGTTKRMSSLYQYLALVCLLVVGVNSQAHPGPAHPGPAHPDPAYSGSAHNGPAHVGAAHSGAAHALPAHVSANQPSVSAHPGPAHVSDSQTYNSAHPGPAHVGPAYPGLAFR